MKLENGQLTAEDVGGQSIKLTGPNVLGRYSGDTAGFYRFWIAQGIDSWGMSGNESGILLGSSDGGNLRACIKTKLGGLSFCTDGTTNANAVERFLIATGGAITASGNFSATGHVTSVIQSLSTDPTGSDLASGQTRTIKNTSTGTTKVWLNDGGTFKSLTFV